LGKKTIYGWKLNRRYGLITDYPDRCNHYCPTRGMAEKPSPSDENFNLSVGTAARIQEVKGSRIQATAGMVFSLDPSNPWILGPQTFGSSRRELTLDPGSATKFFKLFKGLYELRKDRIEEQDAIYDLKQTPLST
jgi:hypothetical protein